MNRGGIDLCESREAEITTWENSTRTRRPTSKSGTGYTANGHIGPRYLLRILVLVLWASNPYKFAKLSDLWAVDWLKGRTVGMDEAATARLGDRTAVMASRRRPSIRCSPSRSGRNGRGGPRRARAKSLQVSASRRCGHYELHQGSDSLP